jgi:hypothetical protein
MRCAESVCEKPKIKCAECQHRRFLPVTDEVIRCHLAGQDGNGWDFTMGVYPMLLDETCFFVVADFDKATWREDARAYIETCHLGYLSPKGGIQVAPLVRFRGREKDLLWHEGREALGLDDRRKWHFAMLELNPPRRLFVFSKMPVPSVT